MTFGFIRDHLVSEFTVLDCCGERGVGHSDYYRWRKEPVRRCEMAQAELVEEIKVGPPEQSAHLREPTCGPRTGQERSQGQSQHRR